MRYLAIADLIDVVLLIVSATGKRGATPNSDNKR
jgi:hypothetical protein